MLYLAIILSYLLGSIPFALLIGKVFYKADIRNHGSGNLGATNSVRVLGPKAGALVALGDVAKGTIAASLVYVFNLDIDPFLLGLAAILGHCFPIFAGFRGGKAIATIAGVLVVANPLLAILTYVIFFAVIWATKYVVFGSLSVGSSLLLFSIMMNDLLYVSISVFLVFFLLYLHRVNIKNLMNKNEPKVNDKRIKEDRI